MPASATARSRGDVAGESPADDAEAAQLAATAPMPPGPSGLPGLGVSHRLLRDVYGYLPQLAHEYGDVVHVPLPFATMILVSHPEHVNHVFNRHSSRYSHSHEVLDAALVVEPRPLPALDGEQWKRHRRAMQPRFTEKALAHVSALISDAITDCIAAWDELADDERPADLQHELGVVVMSALMRSMFTSPADRPEIERWVHQSKIYGDFFARGLATAPLITALPFGTTAYHALPWPHLRKGRATYREMMATLDALIADRVANPIDGADVLNMMLDTRFDDGTSFTQPELRSELAALMFAGFETTATAAAWTIAMLIENPDALAQARAEVDALGATPARYEHIAQLPYVRACFDEGQRVQASLPFMPRVAAQDDVIAGFRIPKGAIVVCSPAGLQNDPRFWSKPERFSPRRFIDDEINKYAYLPFGVGPRRCLGMRMANIEGVLILAAALQRFEFSLPEGWEPKRKFQMSTGLKELDVTLARRTHRLIGD